jgi:hypothetical protein|tara:strand:- start:4954 stop:5682 length:729 start_codon:yes stop_codon:yes gene_type:complete
MAISGTYTFNPDISELVEEAYERAGLQLRSGYDLRTARRSLNFLMLEWQNRGLNLWTISQEPVFDLVKGTADYNIALGTIGLLDVVLRTNAGVVSTQSDYHLSRVSEPTYANIPSKLTQARPLQYLFNRVEILSGTTLGADVPSTITLWPIPDKSNEYTILYWRVKRIADTGGLASNTMQVPDRFLPALVAGLAYQIASKRPEAASRIPFLKQQYEETFMEAAAEDRVKTSARFVPRISYTR